MTSEPLGWGQLLRGEPGRGFELQLGWGPGGTPALPVSWTAVSLPAQPTQSPRLRLSWSAGQGPGGCGGAYGVLRDPDPTPARGRDGPWGLTVHSGSRVPARVQAPAWRLAHALPSCLWVQLSAPRERIGGQQAVTAQSEASASLSWGPAPATRRGLQMDNFPAPPAGVNLEATFTGH